MSEHTPIPWSLTDDHGQFPNCIKTDCGTCQVICQMADEWERLPFAKGTAKANAEFIVRACNHHDDLLEALGDTLSWMSCECGHPACKRCRSTIEAREVIARARKGATP